jgi:hypothetical protein
MQPHKQEPAMRILLSALLLLAASPVLAATTASWNSLDKAARTACERQIVKLASKAKVAGVTGRISGTGSAEDADRFYGLILNGKTAGFASQWLCLYDKRAKTAVAREIEKP